MILYFFCKNYRIVILKKAYAFAPIFPAEVLDLLQFKEVIILILKSPLSLPRHHPDVLPLVPQSSHARALDLGLDCFAAIFFMDTIIDRPHTE